MCPNTSISRTTCSLSKYNVNSEIRLFKLQDGFFLRLFTSMFTKENNYNPRFCKKINSSIAGVSAICLRPCLHSAVCHCHTQNKFVIPSKNGEAIFNVAEIKYHFLSNGGHSVRFLNRFGKFIQSSNRISEMFLFSCVY